MIRWTLLMVSLVAICAEAQDARPTVTPFPLDIRRSGLKEKEEKELASEFRRLVRATGVIAPDPASLDSALKELKRQDCDKENECLKQLALKAGTLYAVYVSVDIDYTRTKVLATGRVVRDDGVLMGAPGQEIRTVSIVKGKDSFAEVAKVAMAQLLEQLGIRSLSPVRPAVVVADVPKVEVKATVVPDGGVAEAPPPMPPLVSAQAVPPMKLTGMVLTGAGAAAAVAGAVVFATARPVHIDGNGNVAPGEAAFAVATKSQQTIGVTVLSVGLGVAAAGAVMWAVSPSGTVVGFAPIPGAGAAVVVGGSLP